MNNLEGFAKLILAAGVLIILVGAFLLLAAKLSGAGFKMPGDIFYRGKNFSFYFPIVTCLVISLLFSVLFNIFFRR
ncbi:MAG: DUF2905 domain-containing protein [Syntrophomonadaceae bacterium]|jgi:hypothetical protein|nr:DUF2905 domain-containing protein [Syntrophomonadaceae bacterium]